MHNVLWWKFACYFYAAFGLHILSNVHALAIPLVVLKGTSGHAKILHQFPPEQVANRGSSAEWLIIDKTVCMHIVHTCNEL